MHFLRHWKCKNQPNARAILLCTIVWCSVAPSTAVCTVQRVYCCPCTAKPFYGSHRLDLVIVRPPDIDNGAFVVFPDTVWYAWVLLLFSASVATDADTGTIQHHLHNVFPGAPGDRRQGAGDGCRMWFLNSLALGWSRDM